MRTSGHGLRQHISYCLVVILLAPFMAAQQGTTISQDAESVSAAKTQSLGEDTNLKIKVSPSEALPDSPGSVRLQMMAENRGGWQESPQSPSQQEQNNAQPTSPQRQQNPAQEPVGTAAAGPVKATGVAASQPAGAAIAPAKQRRTRSILIKVSALVGAGIAVGTVVALSSASPSRPR
jgi:hypothetical protein